MNSTPSQALLLRLFRYEAETGVLFWKTRAKEDCSCEYAWKVFNTAYAGKMAGVVTRGYITISIRNKKYFAHRLIWKMIKGREPAMLLDHINGNRSDNRIENIREADRDQNSRNKAKRKDNTTGITGVGFYKPTNKWRAEIGIGHGKMISLGYFNCLQDAKTAREIAIKKYHREFASSRH